MLRGRVPPRPTRSAKNCARFRAGRARIFDDTQAALSAFWRAVAAGVQGPVFLAVGQGGAPLNVIYRMCRQSGGTGLEGGLKRGHRAGGGGRPAGGGQALFAAAGARADIAASGPVTVRRVNRSRVVVFNLHCPK